MTLEQRLDQRREDQIRRRLTTCKHFSGVQHDRCAAEQPYHTWTPAQALPCLEQHPGDTRQQGTCERRELPTREEVDADLVKAAASYQRHAAVRNAVVEDMRAKGLGRGHGGNGSVQCPNCQGTVHYGVASCNGHTHGACTTPGCCSWMQ